MSFRPTVEEQNASLRTSTKNPDVVVVETLRVVILISSLDREEGIDGVLLPVIETCSTRRTCLSQTSLTTKRPDFTSPYLRELDCLFTLEDPSLPRYYNDEIGKRTYLFFDLNENLE